MPTSPIARRTTPPAAPVCRARVALSVYAAAAAALCVVAMWQASVVSTRRSIPWFLLAAVFAATDLVQARYEGERALLQLDLLGGPAAVGAVYASAGGLLLGAGVAAAVTAVARRNRPGRVAFQVVNQVAGAATARLVASAVLGHGSPARGSGIAAVIATCVAFEVLTMLARGGAGLVNGRPPSWSPWKAAARHSAVMLPISVLVAVVTTVVVYVETWGLALLSALAVALGVWHRSTSQARTRYDNLQKLYALTVRVAGLGDTDEIIAATLEESRRVFGASHAEVLLTPAIGDRRCRLDGGAMVRDEDPPTELEAAVARGHQPYLANRKDPGRLPSGSDLIGVMVVPVPLGDLGTAVMTVGRRADAGEGFDEEDLRFFGALAANLGTALTSSQRLEQLRREVAAREHQALHDGLTGLANRTLFGRWVSEALEGRADDELVGLLVMDLDGFKDINDTLGHHTGDVVLKHVAGRVRAGAGAGLLSARLGGDEFAFVIPRAKTAEDVLEAARSVMDVVARPVTVDGLVMELRASLGVAVAPHDGADLATLLRRADVAMYAAKSGRLGVVAYDKEIDRYARRRLLLTNELHQAIDRGQLEVWYQPVARLSTAEVIGMEALLRWRHAEHGPIPPSEFIPVAEQSGLIDPLTWWVLATALRELARWRQEGYDLTMSVNVSARNLLGPDVPDRLRRTLIDAGIPAGDLTLELTESLMMIDSVRSQGMLEELAELGVRLAIDDFGTGYSSLSRLKKLPVSTVKVDRSFVTSMHRDEGDEAIVRATIELARNMGHEVVAEGVERRDTWDRLETLGCNLAQGHLLAPAMPIEVCREWLRSRQSPQMASIRTLHDVRRA